MLGYELRNRKNGVQIIYAVAADQRQYFVAGMIPAQSYLFDVRALNAFGWSDWSANSSIATQPGAPDTPAPPAYAYLNGSATLTITITPPNDNGAPILKYLIKVRRLVVLASIICILPTAALTTAHLRSCRGPPLI